MKRSYDNSVSGNGRGVEGIIATGQMATKDAVYMNSNMVNIQREDHTELHGIETQFNQTRVLPIVGKTSRAEIALKSADIQTKALPIFQPQVQINPDPVRSDINRLIYEVGLSATWRNCITYLPPDDVTLSSEAITGLVDIPSSRVSPLHVTVERDNDYPYWGVSTFQNAPNASLPLIDSYNRIETLSLFPTSVTNTQLRALFNYYRGLITPTNTVGFPNVSSLRNTCLTPVVVPSVKSKITFSEIASVAPITGSMVLGVESTEGFKAGDRLRLFGCRDSFAPRNPIKDVYTTVISVIQYQPIASPVTTTLPALVVALTLADTVIASSFFYSFFPYTPPCSIEFIVPSNAGYTVGQTITVTGATDSRINRSYIVDSLGGTVGITCLLDLKPPPNVTMVQTVGPQTIFTPTSLDGFAIGQRIYATDFPTVGGIEISGSYDILLITSTTLICNNVNILPDFFPTPYTGSIYRHPISSTATITEASSIPIGGYVINETVKNGGHIEFLTDEQEFAPLQFVGRTSTAYTGTIILEYKTSTQEPFVFDSGFYRGYRNGTETHPMNAAVELLLVDNSGSPSLATTRELANTYNGYYSIVRRISNTQIELAPISKAFHPGVTYPNLSTCTFVMTLAPNYYTFDTRRDEIINPVTTTNKLNFMRALGYLPTVNLPTSTPTYPPTASIPSQTWTRAYTVNWDFSAYRNLQWLTQDTTSLIPRKPLLYQDFGADNGSSTYYNVYEINKFINDCVNPGIERVINDTTYEVNQYEAYSLDGQLALSFNAYKQLFQGAASNFLFDPNYTYTIGQLAVTGVTSTSLAFVAAKTSPGAIPIVAVSTSSWIFLGYVPYQAGDLTPFALCLNQQIVSGRTIMTASVEIQTGGNALDFPHLFISYGPPNTIPNNTSIITTPVFTTIGPAFHYNELTLLSSIKYDGYGFGTVNVFQPGLEQQIIALNDYTRRSWGNQGSNNADEWVTFESNTSFKFLFDNFPSYCTAYEDTLAQLRTSTRFPSIAYWVWDSTSSHDPRTDTQFYDISQSSESLSSCMSPVESIVVVSENIPVLEELSSPAFYLIDSDSSSYLASNDTVSLTNKIIGEIPLWHFAPYNVRSVVRYDANELHYYALLDTKLFKQLEYSLYYRHRITQQLVPLVLSNYGSVNIKFVFRPIS